MIYINFNKQNIQMFFCIHFFDNEKKNDTLFPIERTFLSMMDTFDLLYFECKTLSRKRPLVGNTSRREITMTYKKPIKWNYLYA